MKPDNTIEISRAVFEAGVDLNKVLSLLWEAVKKSGNLFGATDAYDLVIEEAHLGYLVVKNYMQMRYYVANYDLDENYNITFTNVKEVKKLWAELGNGIERSVDDQTIPVYWKHQNGMWDGMIL